jgi:hypothetical protein
VKPSTLRWVVALVLLVSVQLAAKVWGEVVEASPPWDFTFDRPERARVFWPALLLFLVGNTACLVRLLPPAATAERWSLASIPGSLAGLVLFGVAVLGATGLVVGVNELIPRAPDERRTGVVAGYLHAADGTEITVVRFGERETLEMHLPRNLTKELPPESPVALEFHHGILFTGGRVQRLGPPAEPTHGRGPPRRP